MHIFRVDNGQPLRVQLAPTERYVAAAHGSRRCARRAPGTFRAAPAAFTHCPSPSPTSPLVIFLPAPPLPRRVSALKAMLASTTGVHPQHQILLTAAGAALRDGDVLGAVGSVSDAGPSNLQTPHHHDASRPGPRPCPCPRGVADMT